MVMVVVVMAMVFLKRGWSEVHGADAKNSSEISAFVRLEMPARTKSIISTTKMMMMITRLIMVFMMMMMVMMMMQVE